MNAGELGIISLTDGQPGDELEAYVRRVEEMGYGSVWLPELFGREPFSTAAWLLGRTQRIQVATGIANVYARDAMTAAQCAQTLAELSGGRFAMGLGVSHPPMAEMRGHEWIAPGRKMRVYLQTIRDTEVQSVSPEDVPPIIVAAHGPVLLRTAAELADGAFGYLMPPEHGDAAKAVLGDKPLLTVLPVAVDSDRDRALETAQKGLAMYMALPAYHRAWARFGLDVSDPVTLIDAIGAFGDVEHVHRKIREYLDSGTDQVVLSPFHGDTPRSDGGLTRLEVLESLIS